MREQQPDAYRDADGTVWLNYRQHNGGLGGIYDADSECEPLYLLTVAEAAAIADEAAAETLREAADAWTQGAWSDVMLPKPTPPAVPVIAYSNRVGDWLRERAGGDA